MSLVIGTAPFGEQPGGAFNFQPTPPGAVLYFEDSPRWVRGIFKGETVVDCKRVKLLHEREQLPVWYFPREDVRMDLLHPTDHSTRCPIKGEARYWSLRVGQEVSENAAWSYPEPIASAPALGGYVAFYWQKMGAWFEEDEEVFVHPRDPYHRVDLLRSSRRVRVSLDGEVLADTARPTVVFETGLPPRFYLPIEDVRPEVLVRSDKHSRCPYKGIASYFSVKVGSRLERDLVWFYPDPLPEAAKLTGLLCFYNEQVDLELDGARHPRPRTRYSR